jgi:hypothetical protein
VWHAKVSHVVGGILLAWEASNRGFDNKSRRIQDRKGKQCDNIRSREDDEQVGIHVGVELESHCDVLASLHCNTYSFRSLCLSFFSCLCQLSFLEFASKII